ncbi:MAG TPA: hypothetical protein EYP24_01225 [bacterium (Candidatus Stahlbacteria)]|nr:hypothetical protein [Candidatus Stahlbacteria bacterium]
MMERIVESVKGSRQAVCLGIGNPAIPDDSRGIHLARCLAASGVKTIIAGLYPENHLEEVVKEGPDLVLITDTVRSAPSGYIITEEIPTALTTTTHALPLSTLTGYLKMRANCPVVFVGVDALMGDDEIEGLAQELIDALHQPVQS